MTNNGTEERIIREARRLFMERGYDKTSMSDIAQAAGINRPALHYYFRTKEKMFSAVFADIVAAVVPKIEYILSKDRPIGERIGEIVDEYMETFMEYPSLPAFILGEANRDISHLEVTVKDMGMPGYFMRIRDGLQVEMDAGRLRHVPIHDVLFTFYGLMLFPVLSRNMVNAVFVTEDLSYSDILSQWKPYIVSQMEHLLLP